MRNQKFILRGPTAPFPTYGLQPPIPSLIHPPPEGIMSPKIARDDKTPATKLTAFADVPFVRSWRPCVEVPPSQRAPHPLQPHEHSQEKGRGATLTHGPLAPLAPLPVTASGDRQGSGDNKHPPLKALCLFVALPSPDNSTRKFPPADIIHPYFVRRPQQRTQRPQRLTPTPPDKTRGFCPLKRVFRERTEFSGQESGNRRQDAFPLATFAPFCGNVHLHPASSIVHPASASSDVRELCASARDLPQSPMPSPFPDSSFATSLIRVIRAIRGRNRDSRPLSPDPLAYVAIYGR
jgi:hypothetical protein